MKISTLIVGAAMTIAALSGCGSDGDTKAKTGSNSGGSYCKILATTIEEHLPAEDGAELADPMAAFAALSLVAKQSPDAVKGDWKVVDDTTQTMLQSLKDAGVTFEDLDRIFEGDLPDGVDPSVVEKIGTAFAAATSPEYATAQDNVQKHAKAECDLDLDLGTDN